MSKNTMEEKNKKIRLGFKSKILSIVLPVIIIMVCILIAIAYTVSRTNIMDSSRQLLATSAKNQSHQIENWLNRKLDVAMTVKYDIENSGALTDDKLMKEKLDYYLNLDSAFAGGFYVADLNGKVLTASDSDLGMQSAVGAQWFDEGKTRKNLGITRVYTNEAGDSVISACGLLNDLNNLRVLSVNLSLDSINIIVNSSVSMPDAESLLIDKTDGTVLVARDASLVSKSMDGMDDKFLMAVADKIKSADYSLANVENKETVIKEISGTNWLLVSYIDEGQITKEVDELRNVLIIVAVVCLVLLVAIVYFTVHFAVRSLSDLNAKIKVLSEGDFTVDISPKGNDEVAQIQRSMRLFVGKMREMIREINVITEKIQNQADDSSSVSVHMHDSSEAQVDAIGALSDTMEQFSMSINEIAESATNLSSVVADTCTDSDDVKVQIDATVEMSRKGREDMENVNEAMTVIKESIRELVEAINQVGAATKEITGITTLIGNISEETSLLSLNASIEAARAGEAGRGFAVVADEIRQLSEQTQTASNHITSIIKELMEDTKCVTDSARNSVASVTRQNELIESTGEKFSKVNEEVEALARNIVSSEAVVENILKSTGVISENIKHLSSASEEIAAASGEGIRTSEQTVSDMKSCGEILAAIYELAADLKQSDF